jgi:hypothetical protein
MDEFMDVCKEYWFVDGSSLVNLRKVFFLSILILKVSLSLIAFHYHRVKPSKSFELFRISRLFEVERMNKTIICLADEQSQIDALCPKRA